MENKALDWWNSLSDIDRENKKKNYCAINNISIINFNIEHIVDMYELNHPNRMIKDIPTTEIIKDYVSALAWFRNKTHLEKKSLSDIYFNIDQVYEIYENEVLNAQKNAEVENISKVELQILENQKIIMVALSNLIDCNQYELKNKIFDTIKDTEDILKLK